MTAMNNNPVFIEVDKSGRSHGYDAKSRLLKSRIVFLTGVITDDVASSIISQLLFLDSISVGEPIKLYINTPGGLCEQGYAICDTINLIESPVDTLALGSCHSMGCAILASGRERKALPRSFMMLHEVQSSAYGPLHEVVATVEHANRLQDFYIDLLANVCKKERDFIENILEKTKFFTSYEAKDLGLINEVLETKNGRK